MQITPVTAAIGVDITDVDLASADVVQVAAIRSAVVRHHVVMIRGQQHLGLDGLEAFTRRLGTPIDTPYVQPMNDRPDVVRVVKEADERALNFGGGWHTDLSYLAAPPSFTLLWALDVPTYGGDTMWSNQSAAYESLSSGLQECLQGLRAVHSAGLPYGPGGAYDATQKGRTMTILPSAEAFAEQEHPVVVAHPETGRPALFLNSGYVTRFAGWAAHESKGLMSQLMAHSLRDTNTCRMRWANGTLAIWDNRATQHNALNDYAGFRRELFRTTVAGTPPVAYTG
ncbi:unannotated protein [freshwater metagenome]|uniref:Unannotated protein n=1 Tax=freshwater metagenome TaxID=449393 RepID=A0A6J7EUP3_9ZZZZ